jgi:hypothetical protein
MAIIDLASYTKHRWPNLFKSYDGYRHPAAAVRQNRSNGNLSMTNILDGDCAFGDQVS